MSSLIEDNRKPRKEISEGRVERVVLNTLKANKDMTKLFGNRMYQRNAVPNVSASKETYLVVERVSEVVLDRSMADDISDVLRQVRLQIDIYGTDYNDTVDNSEEVRYYLQKNFPSCIDDVTTGTDKIGTTVWNVISVDIILTEAREKAS